MIDLNEINKTILMLEEKDTTYATCEKLADLYIVRDHLAQPQKKATQLMGYGESDFLTAVAGKDSAAVWGIIDDLMETLKVVNGRVYDSVLRKIREL